MMHYSPSNPNHNHEMAERLKEKEDKVSLLEYELRRAREDISNLRNQLTNFIKKNPQQNTSSPSPASSSTPHSSSPSSSSFANNGDMDEQTMLRLQREGIRDHEVKILNYLIKNYLVQNKYSLTAITFAEEVFFHLFIQFLSNFYSIFIQFLSNFYPIFIHFLFNLLTPPSSFQRN